MDEEKLKQALQEFSPFRRSIGETLAKTESLESGTDQGRLLRQDREAYDKLMKVLYPR